jgi:hypothetical protein
MYSRFEGSLGLVMSFGKRLGAAAAAVVAVSLFVEVSAAQRLRSENLLDQWSSVPRTESGLVFIIDGNVSEVSLKGPEGKVLNTTRWRPKLPFVKQYRVVPGIYRIRISAPIRTVSVRAKPGDITYVKFSPYHDDKGHFGVYVTGWVGPVSDRVEGLLRTAKADGIPGVYETPFIASHSKRLRLSTDPPWPIPPRPVPPPPPRQ